MEQSYEVHFILAEPLLPDEIERRIRLAFEDIGIVDTTLPEFKVKS